MVTALLLSLKPGLRSHGMAVFCILLKLPARDAYCSRETRATKSCGTEAWSAVAHSSLTLKEFQDTALVWCFPGMQITGTMADQNGARTKAGRNQISRGQPVATSAQYEARSHFAAASCPMLRLQGMLSRTLRGHNMAAILLAASCRGAQLACDSRAAVLAGPALLCKMGWSAMPGVQPHALHDCLRQRVGAATSGAVWESAHPSCLGTKPLQCLGQPQLHHAVPFRSCPAMLRYPAELQLCWQTARFTPHPRSCPQRPYRAHAGVQSGQARHPSSRGRWPPGRWPPACGSCWGWSPSAALPSQDRPCMWSLACVKDCSFHGEVAQSDTLCCETDHSSFHAEQFAANTRNTCHSMASATLLRESEWQL